MPAPATATTRGRPATEVGDVVAAVRRVRATPRRTSTRIRRTTAATTTQVVGKRLAGPPVDAAGRTGDGATAAGPGCAPPAGEDHAGEGAAAAGEAGGDQEAAAGAGAEGTAGPAEIGLAQEGAARWWGTAAAGFQAFGSTGGGEDGGLGGSQAPVAEVGGAAGPDDAADAAAAPGCAAWHFQQLSAAFFEPQLSQVHNSMEDSPRRPRPPRPSHAPVPRKATPRRTGKVRSHQTGGSPAPAERAARSPGAHPRHDGPRQARRRRAAGCGPPAHRRAGKGSKSSTRSVISAVLRARSSSAPRSRVRAPSASA